MSLVSILYGVVLILIGVAGYFGSGRVSVTALIPAFFGLPILALGVIAAQARDKVRMHVMHALVAIAVLAVVGSARGLVGLAKMVSGGQVERPPAVLAQSAMAIASAIFVALCVQSFVAARRARKSAPAP